MTSQKVVPVAKIEDIREHPNADNLKIVDILGWQICAHKDNDYEINQLVVYVPPDSMLPEYLSDQLNVTQYLSHGRVKAIKLRGEPSYGMTIPIPEGKDWQEGDNVADYFGITHYEPPVHGASQKNVSRYQHPLLSNYTDIDNLRNFPWLFEDDEFVYISEKLHGSSVKIASIEEEIHVGSRRLERDQPRDGENDHFWYCYLNNEPAQIMLEEQGKLFKQAVLYGEVVGPGIQQLHYGLKPGQLGFYAFDILLDGKFLNPANFYEMCEAYGIAVAPLLYSGPYSLDVVKQHAGGKTELNDNHIREGVVVKPEIERTHRKVGRVIAKYLSDDYLLSKGKEKETSDV